MEIMTLVSVRGFCLFLLQACFKLSCLFPRVALCPFSTGTNFDVDEIAQMFQDLDDLIVPDDGPPLPPLPALEEEEHVAPGPSHAEPSIRDVVERLEAVGSRVEALGGEIAGLKEEFASEGSDSTAFSGGGQHRAEASWSRW